MKAIHKKLNSIEESLRKRIEKRDFTFMSKTDEWQNSEKGNTYSYKTEILREVLFNVEDAKNSVDEFLNED